MKYQAITANYLALAQVEREGDSNGIAARVFDNDDFGYYKVNIERPDRRSAQFTPERIAPLRFDKALREPMEWVFSQWGEAVYEPETLKANEQGILGWCEENELNLNAKNRKKLLSRDSWIKGRHLFNAASQLLEAIGQQTFTDFNQFRTRVDQHLKTAKLRLGASEKNAILNAVSWYDPQAEKVIRKTEKLSGEKLEKLLKHLGCEELELADFGCYPTDKAGEYLTYEPCSDLRDSESIPLKDHIHRYFVAEVKPHVAEAWINLDSTKIGYEISFNKYFYRHKPLRSMEAVAADIVALEQQAEGLIADILGLGIAEVSGVEHG